jgi:nucleoside-diphosphate-sugar epimerase
VKNRSVLLVGCGDIGLPLAMQLMVRGAKVTGLRRDPSALPASIEAIAADVTDLASLAPLKQRRFDTVVVTLTPGAFSDQRYQQIYVQGLRNLLATVQAGYWFFVSSTSVYHQSDESWVDEDSPTEPTSFSGQRLLEAEALLRQAKVPHTVLRFAGIYGPGRRRLIDQVLAGESSPPIYSNRIHRDDCVGLLAFLVEREWAGVPLLPCYIGVDDEPVKLSEVKYWLAQQLGLNPAAMTAQATTRRGSKRCSNARMHATGYQLRYPDFRLGYSQLLADEQPGQTP